ncbi:hypothetical protein DMH08_26970 [Actinomadura sp. WAC 06369]|nr:hypothetical protein DMH08_26970 [Actinomadura sp. WAC 06369]
MCSLARPRGDRRGAPPRAGAGAGEGPGGAVEMGSAAPPGPAGRSVEGAPAVIRVFPPYVVEPLCGAARAWVVGQARLLLLSTSGSVFGH